MTNFNDAAQHWFEQKSEKLCREAKQVKHARKNFTNVDSIICRAML